MNCTYLDQSLYLACELTIDEGYNEIALLQLNLEIEEIRIKISEELDKNLFGQHELKKHDTIVHYLVPISKIKTEVLSISDLSDLENGNIALKKINDLFQYIIDTICSICLQYTINLKKIVELNHYIENEKLDFSIYYNEILNQNRQNIIEQKTYSKKLIESFVDDIHLEFFEYLILNFDECFSDHNKYSCIYRLMITDNYLDSSLKAEMFKNILKNSRYKPKIEHSLFTEAQLSKKIIKHYNDLKVKFWI